MADFRSRQFLPFVGILTLLSACTAISCKPALSLGPSPVKIPAKIQVETFVDRSPSEDKTKRAGGSSAAVGWITLPINPIWLLGVPMQSSEGGVDLEVSIRRPDGTVNSGLQGGRKRQPPKSASCFETATIRPTGRITPGLSSSHGDCPPILPCLRTREDPSA